MTDDPLSGCFYDRPVLDVARDLLGCVVSHEGVSVRLTEVEAYDGERDPGSHAFRGCTPRTEVMFGPPGGLYVYFTYGMHFCANLVCRSEGRAAAVLLRAGEVVVGEDVAIARRRLRRKTLASSADTGADWVIASRDLARGPARLATCLALGREQNGLLTTDPGAPVRVVRGDPVDDTRVSVGPRVGVSGPGGDPDRFPWRLWIGGERTVSVYRPAVSRRRRG
ncbi:DNA-3-methyladenine glycosylase [Austwickia chelonae]|uniref:Putative 3-methyladenine DNA glycosylase n=1 Tax=Austwickia chelonae NBRC 105200 TaxID=1184607 RepID=K6VI60_9MICO|nr:DNA-3-methyladenine glycosylase [Austwickia chelonae]GAB76439.1 putative 3-methyladenine DNA glycosylase [Austwickia chelonae NBRC 105200]SEW24687.1 DNA-3-methyladenine glycosylase [Austwickia chelonae]